MKYATLPATQTFALSVVYSATEKPLWIPRVRKWVTKYKDGLETEAVLWDRLGSYTPVEAP